MQIVICHSIKLGFLLGHLNAIKVDQTCKVLSWLSTMHCSNPWLLLVSYNILLYHHIQHSIRLTELKTLNQLLLEADCSKQQFKPLFAHMWVFRYCDNIQISWNFKENSQILVAFFKAPAGKPKQMFISRERRVFQHFIAIKWAQFEPGHITKSLFAIID